MRFHQIKNALMRTYDDVQRKHTMQMAAGLSYYFVMSFFPLLIMFAAVVAYLPIPNGLEFIGLNRKTRKDSGCLCIPNAIRRRVVLIEGSTALGVELTC